MTIIKELLTEKELERMAMLLGFKQEMLKQHTLQAVKEALKIKVKDLQILEDEKLEEANNLLIKSSNLTEQDWKDSLNDDAINTDNLKNSSLPVWIARFSFGEKELLKKIDETYMNITGRRLKYTIYTSLEQVKNDITLPEDIKQGLLNNPIHPPFILAILKFDNKEQSHRFMEKIPAEVKCKLDRVTIPIPAQTETEETQQQPNYSSPSPFSTRLTPSYK